MSWTDDKDEILRQHFKKGQHSAADISREFFKGEISASAIVARANRKKINCDGTATTRQRDHSRKIQSETALSSPYPPSSPNIHRLPLGQWRNIITGEIHPRWPKPLPALRGCVNDLPAAKTLRKTKNEPGPFKKDL